MEIDLKRLVRIAERTLDNGNSCPEDYQYVIAMAAIMQADCAARQAAAAERQAVAAELQVAHLAKIGDTLSILCDLLADAMTETANLTEQDEPTALHMGGNVLSNGTFRPLDWRQLGADL